MTLRSTGIRIGLILVPLLATRAPAQSTDLPPLPAPPTAPKSKVESKEAKKNAERPSVAPKAAKPAEPPPTPAPAGDPKAARAEATALLKALPVATDKQPLTTAQKALRDAIGDRIQWLDAYEKALKDLDAANHPNPDPAREAADLKNEVERSKAVVESASGAPEKLLPELFQTQEAKVSEAKLSDMRDAIEAIRTEVKEKAEKLEKLRAVTARSSTSPLALIRAERDKTAQRVAALNARRTEREKAVEAARAAEERELASQRLIAFEWEARAETERIRAAEAQIALGVKRLDLVGLETQAREFQWRAAKLTLEQMQGRYRTLADTQQNDLRNAAATEAKKASDTDDALERFKAQKKAELLELRVALINDKKAYAASPRLSLQEQSQLADRAQAEFESLKALLKDDKVSSLDALQLNNDFRRVTRERNLVTRNELNEASSVMAYYENELTQVELDLLSDSRDDRFELENLLTLLDPRRHAEAKAVIEEHEREHRATLLERRAVLEKLAGRAKSTYAQVVRRIDALDEEYAFVRTNLFWIRDSEPIGLSTLREARREARHLLPGAIKLAAEPFDVRLWGRPSVEFGASLVGVALMPFILLYARKALERIG